MDTFFKVNDLKLDVKLQILNAAILVANKHWVDKKDEHYTRCLTDLSFDDVIKKFDNTCHFVVAARQSVRLNEPDFGEVAFCTMKEPFDYFLFIHVTPQNLAKIITDFNLTIL